MSFLSAIELVEILIHILFSLFDIKCKINVNLSEK